MIAVFLNDDHPQIFKLTYLGFTHLNFPAFFRRRNQRVDRKWWAHAGQQQREEDAETPNHLFFASNSTIGASISTHTISRITGTSRTGFHSRINPNTGRLTATTHTSTSTTPQPFSNSVVPTLRNNMVIRGFSKISSSHLQVHLPLTRVCLAKIYITHTAPKLSIAAWHQVLLLLCSKSKNSCKISPHTHVPSFGLPPFWTHLCTSLISQVRQI